MKIYHWNQVLQFQKKNQLAFCIPQENEYQDSKFILIEIDINKVNLDLVSTYEDFKRHGETEEILTVERLISGYKNNSEIPPIILNKENEIIDGIHRLSALLSIKRKKVQAFIEIDRS